MLTVKIHLSEPAQGMRRDGHLRESRHALATLRFHDVADIAMRGFDHLNSIEGISLAVQQRGVLADGSPMTPYIVVSFEDHAGFAADFKCFRVEVVSAIPCAEDGAPLESE